MTCKKTGFHAELVPHKAWIYGDAFEMFGVHWFRICQISYTGPISPIKHFTIRDWAVWHDESKTSLGQNSTMICDPFSVEYHGYEGISV